MKVSRSLPFSLFSLFKIKLAYERLLLSGVEGKTCLHVTSELISRQICPSFIP